MRSSEIFEMTDEELKNKLVSLKQELFNLRFQHTVGQLENPNLLVFCKRDIAKVKTIMRQRELNISAAPTKKGKAKRVAKK